jgi:hypothetical protein
MCGGEFSSLSLSLSLSVNYYVHFILSGKLHPTLPEDCHLKAYAFSLLP